MQYASLRVLFCLSFFLVACGSTNESKRDIGERVDTQEADEHQDLNTDELTDQAEPDLNNDDLHNDIELAQDPDTEDLPPADTLDDTPELALDTEDINPPDTSQSPHCDNTSHSGEATYYNADGSGNCSFAPSPNDLLVAALNTTDYNTAATCGACIQVQGPAGSVLVRMVDRCPGCAVGDIDLSESAFAAIAEPSQGRVSVTWQIIPCAYTQPISYHFKEGSNQWWSAVQIRDHINPVASVRATLDDGQEVELERLNYNYFLYSAGLGPGPYTFEVTDIYGQVLNDTGIPFVEGGSIQGSSNFAPCLH